jgi:hypothetical protein
MVEESIGGNGVYNLPAYDAKGGIALSSTSGSVALASGTAALNCNVLSCTVAQRASIQDLIGYGTSMSISYEGAGAVPMLGIPTAARRPGVGCVDADSNVADFELVSPPLPHNSASPFNVCTDSAAQS